MSCVVAWAEDHGLVRPLLRASPDSLTRIPASGLLWLARAFEQLRMHPSTQWLMHPRYQPMLWAGAPSTTACTTLIDWWAHEAPRLAYPPTAGYPASFGGWPIGDLLQVLSPQRRTRHALVQTPHWVAELILDLTVMRAADQFRDERLLRTIDPACGTGNFLILAVDCGVGPRRGASFSAGPFPRPAPRTGRARLGASSSPQVPCGLCGIPHPVAGHGDGIFDPR